MKGIMATCTLTTGKRLLITRTYAGIDRLYNHHQNVEITEIQEVEFTEKAKKLFTCSSHAVYYILFNENDKQEYVM